MCRFPYLRVLLDAGDGLRSRQLIERFPEDKSCLFCYSLALLEHIATLLGEEDAQETVKVLFASLRFDSVRGRLSCFPVFLL